MFPCGGNGPGSSPGGGIEKTFKEQCFSYSMKKKILGIIYSGFFMFLLFLIILVIANIIAKILSFSLFTEIVMVFNSNILLFIIVAILGVISRIIWFYNSPIKLIVPVLDGIIGVVIIFIFSKIFDLILVDSLVKIEIPYTLISVLVFFLVVFIGYMRIYSEGFTKKRKV